MTQRVWNSGPPPHVGWWEASWLRTEGAWRWWNGERWSCMVDETASPQGAAYASSKIVMLDDIEWTDYYPANARVPRVAP